VAYLSQFKYLKAQSYNNMKKTIEAEKKKRQAKKEQGETIKVRSYVGLYNKCSFLAHIAV